ncbi:hypothetical protein FRC11_001099 [Ceratobasidium sp. 423]|nr:hypothetical protein FRC11_001099 [Ceratobasidium sp. 423]
MSEIEKEIAALGSGDEDEELEQMKARVREMEAEAEKLRTMTAQAGSGPGSVGSGGGDVGTEGEETAEIVDARSVYVGNVDYGATPEELQAHFQAVGTINRITILCDKFTGHPKGFAYVEFAEPAHVQAAEVLNDSLFRGRAIKVMEEKERVSHGHVLRVQLGKRDGIKAGGDEHIAPSPPRLTCMAGRVANNLNPASLPFFPGGIDDPGIIGQSPSLSVRTPGPAASPAPSTASTGPNTAPSSATATTGPLPAATNPLAALPSASQLTPGLGAVGSPYSPYSPYGPGRQGSLALSSGSTSPPRLLRTGSGLGEPQYASPITRSRSTSRENSIDPAPTNGQPTEVLTPTAKSGSVSSSSPPQDYLSANFGQYSIQNTRSDERPLNNLAVTFRAETISPASSVRSIGPEAASFDAHAKASPFLNDILDRLIRCEYANRDIHEELRRIADNVAFLVERRDPSLVNPHAQSQSDELKQLNQRVSALTASVSQLMAIQTQSHLQSMNAGFSGAPSPVTPQLNLLDPPQPHMNRQPPRGPMPARTWSSGSIDPTGRGLAPDSAIRGPDKRRSVTSLIRRDSASALDVLAGDTNWGGGSPRNEAGPVISKWEHLPLAPDLLRSIAKYGVGPPNKIQQRALPFLLRGSDIIAQAPPTQERIAAYVIPAIHVALTALIGKPPNRGPLVVIISTTVDQATQAQRMIRDLGGPVGVRSALGVGTGGDVVQELRMLQQNIPHILCGTPQKLHSLFTAPGGLYGGEVRLLVLDEVDQLIARNLHDFVYTIVRLFPAPRGRPLGSPAVGPSTFRIIGSGRGGGASAESAQAREWKLDALADLLEDVDVAQAIVHVGGMVSLENVAFKLASKGIDAVPLHGEMNSTAKLTSLNKFRGSSPNGTTNGARQPMRVLIVYDVPVKAPDVFQVPLVVNYGRAVDLPKAVEEYAHRVAPAISSSYSRAGVVVNFVTATGGDVEMLRSIECFYKIKCPEVPMSLRDVL